MIICADDFGHAEDINAAILELVRMGRLSAVSCMVLSPHLNTTAISDLRQHETSVDIGLHLEFVEPMTTLSRIPDAEVSRRIEEQYRKFRELFGRAPDFIDGHRHKHEFKNIRDGLVRFVLSLPETSRPYVRNTFMPLSQMLSQRHSFFKCLLISQLGRGTRRVLADTGIRTNSGFAGVYNYLHWQKFPGYLRGFIEQLRGTNGILMIHPGSIENWRRNEAGTLRDADLPAATVSRFKSF